MANLVVFSSLLYILRPSDKKEEDFVGPVDLMYFRVTVLSSFISFFKRLVGRDWMCGDWTSGCLYFLYLHERTSANSFKAEAILIQF